MTISEVTFLKLLEYVDQQFQVITLDMVRTAKRESTPESKPRCLLTFDDGWEDTYTTAYPLLKKFGLPAIVFITTGSVGTRRGFWVEQLKQSWSISSVRAQAQDLWRRVTAERKTRLDLEDLVEWLKHMPAEERTFFLAQLLPAEERAHHTEHCDSMLTWQEVTELSRNGFEIGAHTVNHPLLTYENDTAVGRELRLSKQTLEEIVGKQVRAFAYPNGDWNERVRGAVEDVGYQYAFTTQSGWYRQGEDPLTIRRILLHEGNVTGPDGQFSPAMFSLAVSGRP